MNPIAPTVQVFFTDRMARQGQASSHARACYRDTFRLLFEFLQRLGAIRPLFADASLRHPKHAALISGVLAIPSKRFDKATVSHLTPAEVGALIAATDRSRWEGRRDHALLILVIQTGLRISELTSLNGGNIGTGTGIHVQCRGKKLKDCAVPLSHPTALVLREGMADRNGPVIRCSPRARGGA
ncbi:tyrosine-type recombinase/integrase [Paeniglutamicibacter sp. ORCA_105]|uniref:tyrosine-type recombinase/integrase n=1 Tax=Paeniglutamicibacter sp. ORCA_105 TaxID=3377336 RepID=UPI0038936D3F